GRGSPKDDGTGRKHPGGPGVVERTGKDGGLDAKVVLGLVEGNLERVEEDGAEDGAEEGADGSNDGKQSGSKGAPARQKAKPADDKGEDVGDKADDEGANHKVPQRVHVLLRIDNLLGNLALQILRALQQRDGLEGELCLCAVALVNLPDTALIVALDLKGALAVVHDVDVVEVLEAHILCVCLVEARLLVALVVGGDLVEILGLQHVA